MQQGGGAMIEKKIHKGEYLALGNVSQSHGNPGEINVGCEDRYIARSEWFQHEKRRVLRGKLTEPNKQHRNFIWLPYVPGAINYTPSQGKDVLSGKFSGCYMVAYQHVGGDRRVCHIATPEAKEAWNDLARTPGFEVFCGFKPMDCFKETAVELNLAEAAVRRVADNGVFGIITGENTLFSFLALQVDGAYWKVADFQQVKSLTEEELKNLPLP